MIKHFKYLVSPIVISLLVACGGGGGSDSSTPPQSSTPTPTPSPTPLPNGALVYMTPQATGNTFACVHCHALEEPATDGFNRPGHFIGDALRRPNYKNGLLPNFIDAVNTCLNVWMTVPTQWTEDSPEFLALSDFLTSEDQGVNDGEAPTIPFSKAEPIVFAADNSDLAGDEAAGRTKFDGSCAVCHGENAVGTERAPQLAGRLNFAGAANFIAQKVRLSGPTDHSIYQGESVGGVMPFWAQDRISDADLEDVITFLVNSEVVVATPTPTPTPLPTGECASTHPKIGQQATLSTIAHRVEGVATIVDDCTIRIDAFSFDGGGINIRVYGGDGEFLQSGFSMSDNLLNQVFNNDTLTVKLPSDRTLDDIDRISIWCVPVRTSFGDGVFR